VVAKKLEILADEPAQHGVVTEVLDPQLEFVAQRSHVDAAPMRAPALVIAQRRGDFGSPALSHGMVHRNAAALGPGPVLELVLRQPVPEQREGKLPRQFELVKLCEVELLQQDGFGARQPQLIRLPDEPPVLDKTGQRRHQLAVTFHLRVDRSEARVVVHEDSVPGHDQHRAGRKRPVRYEEPDLPIRVPEHPDQSLDNFNDAAGRVDDHQEAGTLGLHTVDGDTHDLLETTCDGTDDGNDIGMHVRFDLAQPAVCPEFDGLHDTGHVRASMGGCTP